MKTLIALILLLPSFASAGPCETAWKKSDAKQKVSVLCQLEWKSQGIELVMVKNGCDFPNGPVDCALLRACGPGEEGDIGASAFRKDIGADSYCLTGNEEEVFGPSNSNSPLAFITCKGKGRPNGIRLESPDQLFTKNCAFPFVKDK